VNIHIHDLVADETLIAAGGVGLAYGSFRLGDLAGIPDWWSNDPNGPSELAEAVMTYALPYFDWMRPPEVRARSDGRDILDKRRLSSDSRARLTLTLHRMGEFDEALDVLRSTPKSQLCTPNVAALTTILGVEPIDPEEAPDDPKSDFPPGAKAEDVLMAPGANSWLARKLALRQMLEPEGFVSDHGAWTRRRGAIEEVVCAHEVRITDRVSEGLLRRTLPEGTFLKPFTLRLSPWNPEEPPPPWWLKPQPPPEGPARNVAERVLPFLDEMQDLHALARRLGRGQPEWVTPTERFYLAATLFRMGLSDEACAALDNPPTAIPRPLLGRQIAALKDLFQEGQKG
jgi:hypothetical protein